MASILNTVRRCHITLNHDVTTVSEEYTFVGVLYNHVTHQVCIGAKTANGIREDDVETMTVEDLERLLGRLWFAARGCSRHQSTTTAGS